MILQARTRGLGRAQSESSARWAPWQLKALVGVTVANYVWQVPYYLHFYGRFGKGPGGLTVPLLLTFVWFGVGTALLLTRRRGGVPVTASFLVVEALFYLVHNLTGAAGRDLLTSDVVLLVASLLGYLNALAAILFLAWLVSARPTHAGGAALTPSPMAASARPDGDERADPELSTPHPSGTGSRRQLGSEVTRLQQAAYDAQLAAGLPVSELATATLTREEEPIDLGLCAEYLHTIQRTDWFTSAFTGHAEPVVVVGGPGVSHADAAARLVTIGADDRWDTRKCEHACLHELAHIVTPDRGPDHELREPAEGLSSSRGHHQAWRGNFIFIVQMTLGRQAAHRLRHEFPRWGLPTLSPATSKISVDGRQPF